jgi:hypothetical protein
MTTTHRTISVRTIRRAAAAADADIRTAEKVALGLPVRGVVGERVAEALRALGVEPPPVGQGLENGGSR